MSSPRGDRSEARDARRRVADALAELERVARELLAIERHVAPEAKVEAVELPVQLSFHGEATRVASEFRLAEAEKLLEQMRARVRDALLNAVAFERGHVFCLRCESSRCAHSTPATPRSVFAGYEPTGRPEWLELDRLLHRRNDPRIDRLYGRRRELVALALHRDEIYGSLVPGFEEARWRCYVLGELIVGWFTPSGGERDGATMALCVQVVRIQKEPDGALLGINLVGRLPGESGAAAQAVASSPSRASAPPPSPQTARVASSNGEPLAEDVLDGLPDALNRLRRELGVFSGRGGARAPGVGIALERLVNRVHALLKDACRDLEHRRRNEGRRTQHARLRADEGTRPTAKAFEDARSAALEQWFEDREKNTRVVLGPKGRVHFFTPLGKHVTSVVYPGQVIQARLRTKRWVALAKQEAEGFRKLLVGEPTPDESK